MTNEARYREAERRLWSYYGLTPTERRVTLKHTGVSVRVQQVGEGEPVLFVHGASNTGVSWATLLHKFPGYRCVVLDRPGCGLSDPVPLRFSDVDALARFAESLVVDVLDALSIDTVPLVTTSFGGYIGLRSLAAHPDRIERLFEFGWTVGAPTRSFPLFMRVATHPALGRIVTSIPPTKGAVRAMFKRIGLKEALAAGRVPDEVIATFQSMLRDTRTMRNEIDAGPRLVTLRGMNERILLPGALLEGIHAPTYFLWGEEDPFGGADVARAFVGRFPNAELELMPKAGHAVWIDDPERAAETLTKFLSR